MCLSSTGILICGRVGIPDLAQDATQRTLTSFRCSFQTKKKSSESKQVTPQVLANPVNIRRSSAPPVQTRQRSLSSIKVLSLLLSSHQVKPFFQLRPEDDEDSEHNLTPILERKSGRQPFTKKDTVLQLELQFENEMRKPHYYWAAFNRTSQTTTSQKCELAL